MLKDLTKVALIIIFSVLLSVSAVFSVADFFETEESNIVYLTYKDVSTSIDERGRLHITNLRDGKVTIYADSVALGINAQVSKLIFNDFREKAR